MFAPCFTALIAGAVRARQPTADHTGDLHGSRCLLMLIGVKRRCSARAWRERVRAHVTGRWPRGGDLKAESMLCVREDCTFTFTWEKWDYVTSVHREHNIIQYGKAEICNKHY